MTETHKLTASLQAQYNTNTQLWVPPIFPNFFLYNGPAINWVANPLKYGLILSLITFTILFGIYIAVYGKKEINNKVLGFSVCAFLFIYFFSWLRQYRYNNTYLELSTTVSENLMYSDIMGGTTNFSRRRLL